jgi:hypothetical protein
MARGWESKDVEDQIESAEHRRDKHAGLQRDPEEIAREQRCASIQLSRTRVLTDLAVTTHPRRREQLEAALHFLDQQLESFNNRT